MANYNNIYPIKVPVLTDDKSLNVNWGPRILFSNTQDVSGIIFGMDASFTNKATITKWNTLSTTSSHDILNANTYSLLFDSEKSYIDVSINSANTLYKTFYRDDILQNIQDNSFMVTCDMYLTPLDIQELDFSDIIFLSDKGIGDGYYRLNNIKYKKGGLSKVELIKINYFYLDTSNYISNLYLTKETTTTLSSGGTISGGSGGSSGGTVDLTNYTTFNYVDGSLMVRIKDSSLNPAKFSWISGLLEPSVASGTGEVTRAYVDGSLAALKSYTDASIQGLKNYVNSNYVTSQTYEYDMPGKADVTYVNASINILHSKNITQDASIVAIRAIDVRQDASLLRIDASLNNTFLLSSWVNSSSYYDGSLNTAKVWNTAQDASITKITSANFTICSSHYLVNNVSDNFGIIDCSGTFNVIFPNTLRTGFTTTVINAGTGVITLNASTLLATDSSVRLRDRYAGASVIHKGNGVFYALGNLK